MANKYTSLYKDDPIAEELAAGIRGTDVYQGSPYALGNVPGFEGMKYATPDYNKYADLYNLYLGGGFDAAQDDFVTPPAAGGSTGDGGAGTGTGGTGTGGTGGVNTPEQQRLIDAGIGVQLEPGSPISHQAEGMPPTQEEMDAYNKIPVSTDYTDAYTSLGEEAPRATYADQYLDDLYGTGEHWEDTSGQVGTYEPTYADTRKQADLERAGAGIDGMYQTDYFPEYIEPEYIEPQSGDAYGMEDVQGPVIQYKASDMIKEINAKQMGPGSSTHPKKPRQSLKQRNIPEASQALDDEYYDFDTPEIKQTAKIPSEPLETDPIAIEQGFVDVPNVRDKLVTAEDAADPSFFKKLGIDIDPAEAAVKAALNMAVGKPVTLLIDILKNILPEMDPRQKALNEFYKTDDIGRVAEGELMAGYNPVSGGFLHTITGGKYGDPVNYGLQRSYDKRISNTADTLQDKYKLTDGEIDSIKAGNITEAIKAKTISPNMTKAYGKPTVSNLVQQLADLEKDKADEFAMLDQVTDVMGDVQQDRTQADIDADILMGDAATMEEEVGDEGTLARVEHAQNVQEIQQQEVARNDNDKDRQQRDTGVAKVEENRYETKSGDTYASANEAAEKSDHGGGSNTRGCVVATHAVNSGAFTPETKREAVRWCVKNLHRTWWGEAVRKGYRYYGQKAIEEGKVKNHYQEFKDYVAFGTGKRRTLKTAWTFVRRTIQFFLKGLVI